MPSTRRSLLTSIVAGTTALSGCAGVFSANPDDPPPPGVDSLPDPGRHVAGANGEWSSFGCNAANTRVVADGEAPVDGVTEQWRVAVPETVYREPAVADGRIFQPYPDELRVFGADEGDERWTVADVTETPLVRDDRAYVSTGDAVFALDAETGKQLWEWNPETRGRVTTPSTFEGTELVCGAGERVVALNAETGDEVWSRDVYGQVLDGIASYRGFPVATTGAGRVYLLDNDGGGLWRWGLPAPPACPVTVGRESIFVTCMNGQTYGLSDLDGPERDVVWSVDTGWTERGLAVTDGLVVLANGRELQAVDAESGEPRWTHENGNWRHTAPAFGRDTLFVGGDRLWALDPTPGDSADGGPAVRYSQAFPGRVGPGPVLDDGTLYVVVEVDTSEYALVALA